MSNRYSFSRRSFAYITLKKITFRTEIKIIYNFFFGRKNNIYKLEQKIKTKYENGQ
jgi:hypothetical protein